jgi:hypothetical protein
MAAITGRLVADLTTPSGMSAGVTGSPGGSGADQITGGGGGATDVLLSGGAHGDTPCCRAAAAVSVGLGV